MAALKNLFVIAGFLFFASIVFQSANVNAFFHWEEIPGTGGGGFQHYDSGHCDGKWTHAVNSDTCDTCDSICAALHNQGVNCARCQNYAHSPDTYECKCYAPE